MGFGSFKKKFKKVTGLDLGGSAAGFLFGGPVGAALGGSVGDMVSSFINDPTGAKAAAKTQADALRRAGRIEEAQRLEAQALQAQILAETAPFREQAQAELARLGAQKPGETEFFKQGLTRGTEAIAQKAAGFGLLDSGGTRRGFGELGAQLLSQEELLRQQGLQRAAQQSQLGFGLGLGALQQAGGAAYRQAQTEANIGAVQAQGGLANRQFWLGLGTQLGGTALGSLLGGAPGGAAAATQGGFGGGGAGGGGGGGQYQYPVLV